MKFLFAVVRDVQRNTLVDARVIYDWGFLFAVVRDVQRNATGSLPAVDDSTEFLFAIVRDVQRNCADPSRLLVALTVSIRCRARPTAER